MTYSQKLIARKEKQGVMNAVTGKMAIFGLSMLAQIFFSESHAEAAGFSHAAVPIMLLLGLCVYLIRSRNMVSTAGYISLICDIAVIAVTPFIWYASSDHPEIGRSFLLKNLIPEIAFIFLIANSLALRPRYPLIFGTAASAYLSALYVYASMDPAFKTTKDIDLSFNSAAVNPIVYFSTVFLLLAGGIILSITAERARRAIIESAENESKANQLSRYFSPSVAGSIISEGGSGNLFQGQEQMIAIMFSDIRNFTALSESHSAAEIIEMLREYHNCMVQIIFSSGGSIDKFLGDGIMATFGTPFTTGRDAANAVAAALGMREGLRKLNEQREASGRFTIAHGIGIHFGPAIVGNVGSETRLEYTAIGDSVNIASRIEGACKELNRDILMSENAARMGGRLESFSYAGTVSLKGKSEPIALFTV